MALFSKVKIKEKLNKGVVIRGTGFHAAKCTYLFQGLGIEILCYLSQRKNVSTYRGRPVYTIPENPHEKAIIIVATSIDSYLLIAEELRKSGKREFYDFIYYEWIVKDIVLLHGNCHMQILEEMLLSSFEFAEKFSIYPYPLLISSTKSFRIEPEIFEHIDIWIHEDIRSDNIFGYEVSDEYIRRYLNSKAVEIKIPHLYGVGRMFFPQVIELNDGRNEAINDGIDTDGIFLYGDKVIESCIASDMKIDEIVELCESDQALSIKDIMDTFNQCFDKIKQREKSWDIRISDFISKAYKKQKLFFDPGHPTNDIMEYIAKEVLKRLGVVRCEVCCKTQMDAHEKCVYPCVKKALGLEWEETEIRKTGKKLGDHMDFHEFIKEYCWWRHFDIYSRLI